MTTWSPPRPANVLAVDEIQMRPLDCQIAVAAKSTRGPVDPPRHAASAAAEARVIQKSRRGKRRPRWPSVSECRQRRGSAGDQARLQHLAQAGGGGRLRRAHLQPEAGELRIRLRVRRGAEEDAHRPKRRSAP